MSVPAELDANNEINLKMEEPSKYYWLIMWRQHLKRRQKQKLVNERKEVRRGFGLE